MIAGKINKKNPNAMIIKLFIRDKKLNITLFY